MTEEDWDASMREVEDRIKELRRKLSKEITHKIALYKYLALEGFEDE